MAATSYVIGVDFGTDSVRVLIVDALSGEEVAQAAHTYPRWAAGLYCDAARNQFRQHPLDYLEGLAAAVTAALRQCPPSLVQHVKGISIDTTGSTPVAVDKEGTPLALLPGLEENPHAMFILWKDHTAVAEAAEITEHARNWGGPGCNEDYTQYSGGVYSSEWFWAKLLHTLRMDADVRARAFSWVEHCDWMSAVLTGMSNPRRLKRSRCAAGHKALWHERWRGLPSEEFLTQLDPLLQGWRARLYDDTFTADHAAGTLSQEWARKLGLPESVVVGVGAFDAHMGAVGAQIEPYALCKVMGTSTCDMLVAPPEEIGDRLIRGICGQVNGSIVPGLIGMEAGQSAFGDVYAWFEQLLLWPLKHFCDTDGYSTGSGSDLVPSAQDLYDSPDRYRSLYRTIAARLVPELTRQAERLTPDESLPLALDWLNGRRTPDADQRLKGAIIGLTLGSSPPVIFRALVEATAFGARKIVDRFLDEGVPVCQVIALGGVAKKSPFVMQTVADVLQMPMRVVRSEQACALGAAMCASVAAGIHPSLEEAQQAMGSGFEREYRPQPERAAQYDEVYAKYARLGDFIEREMTR